MPNSLPIAINIGTKPFSILEMLPNLVNRHGCITGATGTGKTVTLQVMAQALSFIGVPVFMADVKGDLSGLAKAGAMSDKMQQRLKTLELKEPAWAACPVTFWDVFGEQGHPVRATISDLGPLMLARMLHLNDTQEGVLQLVFKIADDNGLLLLDTKDLRAMLQDVGDHASNYQTEYGNISAASIGAIQRGLIGIEEQGGDQFFGEPMLNIDDMLQTDASGRGVINILAADKLMNAPRLYSTFLLWLLSELYEHLPEVGDLDKPKLVFFFDEAHLLFDEAPKPLLQKIEQVVRLIRSKGVGVFFVTQNPLDIPDTVLGQLGNRVQHALRAFICPPSSQIGPLSEAERKGIITHSIVAGIYEKTVDRESAYENIKGRIAALPEATLRQTMPNTQTTTASASGGIGAILGGLFGSGGSRRESAAQAMFKSAARSIGSHVGREIIRGILGSILKK